MKTMDRDFSGSRPEGGRALVDGVETPEIALRKVFGEIVQRIPSDRYTLTLRSREIGAGRWHRGVIGDVPGPRMLDAIEEGAMFLSLRDVGAELRVHLGPLGFDFPEFTASHEPISHGVVIASRELALTLGATLGSGMLRVIEGRVRLVFAEDRVLSGRVTPEWAADVAGGSEFQWQSARVRRFETGDGMVIALTRAVMPITNTGFSWRLGALVRAMRRLRYRLFGAPERWSTAMLGTAPIGGRPMPTEARESDPDYRLVSRPSPPSHTS